MTNKLAGEVYERCNWTNKKRHDRPRLLHGELGRIQCLPRACRVAHMKPFSEVELIPRVSVQLHLVVSYKARAVRDRHEHTSFDKR